MAEDATPVTDTAAEERPRRRARRRAKARAGRFDSSVASPCIAVCQIDEATDRCIGCLRAIDEIRDWPIMTADEKRAVLARIEERKAGPS